MIKQDINDERGLAEYIQNSDRDDDVPNTLLFTLCKLMFRNDKRWILLKEELIKTRINTANTVQELQRRLVK